MKYNIFSSTFISMAKKWKPNIEIWLFISLSFFLAHFWPLKPTKFTSFKKKKIRQWKRKRRKEGSLVSPSPRTRTCLWKACAIEDPAQCRRDVKTKAAGELTVLCSLCVSRGAHRSFSAECDFRATNKWYRRSSK